LLLVPGSVGFRGLAALLDRQIVSGVDTTFKMILTAMALVAGTLIANIVVPSRRELVTNNQWDRLQPVCTV
jgi:uncharacterized membrane protein YjjB (DUF3815 family)